MKIILGLLATIVFSGYVILDTAVDVMDTATKVPQCYCNCGYDSHNNKDK